MDISIKREAVSINQVAYDGWSEHQMNCDFVLPDYCPEIQKILKCMVTAKVKSKQLMGDKAVVEGVASISTLYLSEGSDQVNCAERTYEFSKNIDVKSSGENAMLEANAAPKFIRCRAVNSRRLEVTGTIAIHAVVVGKKSEELVTGAEGGGIQMLPKQLNVTNLMGNAEKQFSLSEEFETGQTGADIDQVLYSWGEAVAAEYKAVNGKIVVKGMAYVHVIYLQQTLRTSDFTLPISQIVDLSGVDDQCKCDIDIHMLSVQTTVANDETGRGRCLAVSATGEVTARAYKPASLQVAADVYSTDFETRLENTSVSVERLVEKYVSSAQLKANVALGDAQFSEVLDIWPTAVSCESQLGEGSAGVKAVVDLGVLGKNTDGQVVYTEGRAPFEAAFEIAGEMGEGRAEGNLKIKSASFILQDSSNLEARLEGQWEARVFDTVKCQAVSGIQVDVDMPKNQAAACALTIYFADEGESVWEVAKRYNTRPDDIKAENDLAGDVLSEGMILIPSVRS